ncbi:MAG: hypothetical protein E7395_05970 [Ruminococcaceae bacterium]|nr:hypothetical protein [Oscillospiraceae bacterium]
MYKLQVEEYDRHVYETELKSFLPKNIIDFHIHVFSNEIERYEHLKNAPTSWVGRITDELRIEQLKDTFAKLFPENNCSALIFGGTGRDLKETNDYIIKAGKELDCATLYRTNYQMSASQLEEDIKKGGFLGIKPYLSDRPLYIPTSEIRIYDFLPHEHLEVCNRNGWIVMLHIPRNDRFRDPVNLAQLAEIEEKYPNLKLIIAHIGRAYAKEDIGNAFEVVGKGKNTYFDFTANMCDDAIRACLEAVGPKKLIFGSDLPYAIMRMYRIVENGVYYNVVRRGEFGDITGVAHMKETDEKDLTLMIYEQIRALKRVAQELKLTPDDIEDIMYGNAKKLIDEVSGR